MPAGSPVQYHCGVPMMARTLPATAPPGADSLDPEVLTVPEAAEFLKIGRTQLYDAISRGEIPHRKIGRSIRLSRGALVAWLAAPCNAPREGQ